MTIDTEALTKGIRSRFPTANDEFLQQLAAFADDEDPEGDGVVTMAPSSIAASVGPLRGDRNGRAVVPLPAMRSPMALAALLLALTACAADPVLLPDAGPCNGSCGAGTVCQAGACVAVDGGAADVPVAATDAGRDAGFDAGAPEDRPGAPDVPVAATDTPTTDVDQRGSAICQAVNQTCDGRRVSVQTGERDGGLTYHCGGCGRTCAVGEGCLTCNCIRL